MISTKYNMISFYFILVIILCNISDIPATKFGCSVGEIAPGELYDCEYEDGHVQSETTCILQCPYRTERTSITCRGASWQNQHVKFCSEVYERSLQQHKHSLRRHIRSVDDLCLNGFCPSILRCQAYGRPTIQNGYYICHPDTYSAHPGQCRFGCYQGYRMVGQDTVTCHSSNIWSSSFPTCQKITCAALPASTPSLSYTCTEGFNYGSVCTYQCPAGYDISNKTLGAITCPAYGYWTGPVPECVDIESPVLHGCLYEVFEYADRNSTSSVLNWAEPTVSDNHDVNLNVVVSGDYRPGDVIPEGVHLVTYGAKDMSGNRADPCETRLVVKVLRCPEIYPTPYMTVHCPEGYILGATCTFVCQEGTRMVGQMTASCEVSDAGTFAEWSWGDAQPYCEIIPVVEDPLPTPSHGSIECSYLYKRKVCMTSCDPGYASRPGYPITDLLLLDQSGQWMPAAQLPIPDCLETFESSGALISFAVNYSLSDDCAKVNANDAKKVFNSTLTSAGLQTTCQTYAQSCRLQIVEITCSSGGMGMTVEATVEFTLERARFKSKFEELQTHQMDFVRSVGTFATSSTLDLNIGHTTDAIAGDVKLINVGLGCPGNMVASFTTASCVMCPAGTYRDVTTSTCPLCPLGQYQDTAGQNSCAPCPPGMTTAVEGSTSVYDCI